MGTVSGSPVTAQSSETQIGTDYETTAAPDAELELDTRNELCVAAGCEHFCTEEMKEGFVSSHCSCFEGYLLEENGKSCGGGGCFYEQQAKCKHDHNNDHKV